MRTTIILVSILALAATIGTIVVGTRSFEGTVVEKPYETGLAWDEIQRQKAKNARNDCDIQRGPCVQTTGSGMTVEFDIQPKPVAAMSDLNFLITITRGGMPVAGSPAALDLSMPGMFMGKNMPVLKRKGAGRFEGSGIIPTCPSGKKTWQADVIVVHEGKTDVAGFVFEVK